MSRHSGRYLAPTGESIACFLQCWLGLYWRTIDDAFCLIDFPIQHIGQGVAVDAERASNHYIMSRHCLWYLAPAGEGVAFFLQIRLGSDGCSIDNRFRAIDFPIQQICQGVGIYRERTSNLYIVVGHRLRYLAPAAEGVALLC